MGSRRLFCALPVAAATVCCFAEVRRDPRIADAIRRYALLLLDEQRCRYLNLPGNAIATSLAGRALVEIIKPGVNCYRWKRAR